MIFRKYTVSPEKGRKIRFRVHWHKFSASFSIPFNIDVSRWNYEMQRCARNSFHDGISSSVINREIDYYQETADKILDSVDSITKDDFVYQFRVALGKEAEKKNDGDLFKLWDDYVRERSAFVGWSKNTLKNQKNVRNHLWRFNQNMVVDNLNKRTMQRLLEWMQQSGYNNSTIQKTFVTLKVFIRWLGEKKIIDPTECLSFRPKFKGVTDNKTVVYLTWEELTRFFNQDFGTRFKNNVRDVFCFCCFTSLRFSDVSKLMKTDVHRDHIEVVTQKTAATLHIQLNDYSRTILERHSHLPGDKALPVYSNQKTNAALKEMGRAVGLNDSIKKVHFVGSQRIEETKPKWEYLTTHCGRRTFVVNALMLGIPTQVVMSWTGHADYESMKPYIAIAEEQKEESMKLFNKK
ncbi:MAG: site-specific integrase [Paludibacteraceae bacterium]|nr:site-specific integrase [Paludibacteraceae bacterium]